MKYWWKLLGGGVGFMLGGPLGAILGMALGYSFDVRRSHKTPSHLDAQQADQAFFTSTFQIMGYLAKANGRVSEQEIDVAQAVMAHLRLTPAQKRTAIALFNEGKQADFVLETALSRFRTAGAEQAQLLHKFIEIQFSMVYADGIPHPRERAQLLYICTRLGLSPPLFETLDAFVRSRQTFAGAGQNNSRQTDRKSTSRTLLDTAYATLGLKSNATDAEIKQAYRRLLNQHHPDKLAATGVTGEALAQATEKTREIRTAYERIKAARGI